MRVVHAHFAFKFLLPSFNARDVIAANDGVDPWPICGKESDSGDHLFRRCQGATLCHKGLLTRVRNEIEEACAASGADCLLLLAGGGGVLDVETADEICSSLRVLYRQRMISYQAVRAASKLPHRSDAL